MRRTFRLLALLLLALLPALLARPLAGQVVPTRPFADWRTVETEHFIVHYTHEMAEWTLPLTTRLEAVHATVSAMVGNAPARRVTVLVVDPFNLANGSALPFLDSPAMILWPTPPSPRSGIGHHTGWGELLAIHEYGHLAHLTFPTRNPRQQALWRLMPVQVGPVARRSPRWVTEGYATYIEGRLTGSGRPYGAYRPAVLRQWALEGRLPSYGQLSGRQGFLGGSMAYLVGSAFLEWLVEQRGEESLNHLWRRMSAVRTRSFSEAFIGVYGGRPEDLYGRFTVEVTRRALEAQELLEAEGIVEGELVQARDWLTGDPAISPDGSRLALVLPARDRPSRVVIWRTEEEPEEPQAAQARERERQRDPEDVPAIQWRPRPRQALATLLPVDGRPHGNPRFLPDGRWVMVTRSEPMGDGTFRPDLFLWDWETGELVRVTRQAGIREADPSPAGRAAVGVRCLNGICDLVRIELESGDVTVLHHGLPTRVFYRPRYSPNGRQVVVSVQEGGAWRLALTDDNGGELEYLGVDDGASRYDATFLPDGRSIVTVSEAGGVANLERIDLESGEARTLTRVTGAAVAPDPSRADGSLFFLGLHSRGMNLRRLHPDSVPLGAVVALGSGLAPVAPVPASFIADTLPEITITRPRPYGSGPAQFRLLPAGRAAPEGNSLSAVLARTDPVGRLIWLAQGAFGDASTWRGAALNLAWRQPRRALHADLFWARQHPSEQRPMIEQLEGLEPLDVEYQGGTLFSELVRDLGVTRHQYRLGVTVGQLDGAAYDEDSRYFAFGDYQGSTRQIGERSYFSQALAINGAYGRTADDSWWRGVATLGLGAGMGRMGLLTELTYGMVGEDAPQFEHFLAGGLRPGLFDEAILAQRFEMPMLPLGLLRGQYLGALRTTLQVGPVHPYFWAASTDRALQDWFRVVGLERELDLDAIPLGRLPRVQLLAGVSYLLDDPYRDRFRGYISARYRP